MASFGFKFTYGDDDPIIFDYKGRKLKFIGAENNGAIGNVFVQRELDTLDVNGQVVIDIGANFGDSVIYFVLKGAERVIAIEPFPYTFELLNKNLSINRALKKITTVNCALGEKTATIRVSPLLQISVGTIANNVPDGVLIDVFRVSNYSSNDDIHYFSL
jgi:hypothetical protein